MKISENCDFYLQSLIARVINYCIRYQKAIFLAKIHRIHYSFEVLCTLITLLWGETVRVMLNSLGLEIDPHIGD